MKGFRYIAAVSLSLFAATAVLAQSESAGDASATTGAMSVEVSPGLVASVVSLRRLPDNDIVQLDFTLENFSNRTIDLDDAGLGGAHNGIEVSLLDFATGSNYRSGKVNTTDCLCSAMPEDDGLAAGATFNGWAWFMPPASVGGLIAVQFGEESVPILDVPVE